MARPVLSRRAGNAIRSVATAYPALAGSRAYWDLRRSRLGIHLGLLSPQWLPWGMFELAGRIPARPNMLFAFAPAADTYHGVKFSVPADHLCQERRLLRGFVRRGKTPFDRVTYRASSAARQRTDGSPVRA